MNDESETVNEEFRERTGRNDVVGGTKRRRRMVQLKLERSLFRRLNLEREGPLVGALHFAWGARLSSYMLPCNAGLWCIMACI